MKFLLAPNAMKNSLSAVKIAAVMQKTVHRRFPRDTIVPLPIADGGNGTLECLMSALGGTVFEKEVTGPVPSMKVHAKFGITRDRIAIIESAEAAGLHHLTPTPETFARSTTYGVGELIVEAAERGCTEIWIGLGGSATNDGGAGMARALGVQFMDGNDRILDDGPKNLIQLKRIMRYDLLAINRVNVKILSDVQNPLLGAHGATFTYAVQKGAAKEQLHHFESALSNFADTVEEISERQFRNIPGSGAAGGLAFGLMAFLNAEIVSGIEFILDAVRFNEKLEECDCVLTSEGSIDEQTVFGKGIAGIARRANEKSKPVHAFVGRIGGDPDRLKKQLGLSSLTQISPTTMATAEAIANAPWLLADAVYLHRF